MSNVIQMPQKKPYSIIGCYCEPPECYRVAVVCEDSGPQSRVVGLTCGNCGWEASIEDGLIKSEGHRD